MGDRFYTQQLKAIGGCPGAPLGKGKADKAPTKAEVAASLPVDLSALTKADLEKVVQALDSTLGEFSIPEGRLKKPYIAELNKLHSQVDWSKLTVAKMKELIQWLVSSMN